MSAPRMSYVGYSEGGTVLHCAGDTGACRAVGCYGHTEPADVTSREVKRLDKRALELNRARFGVTR